MLHNSSLAALLGLLSLALPACPWAAPVISEIMAVNDDTIADEDGDFPDWIEIANPTASPVSLLGYTLTDDAANRSKWTFPATTLPPYGVIVVFASDKDRAAPGQPLHTNFKLTSDGEYLGLFPPGSAVAVSEFAPAFPTFPSDQSYGPVLHVEKAPLVEPGSLARWHVPPSGGLGATWLEPGFNDAGWSEGPMGLGFGGSGARAHWALDGNAADSTGGGSNASPVGSVAYSSDIPPGVAAGMSLELEGTGALSVPGTSFGGQFTLCAWVKPDAHDNILTIASNSFPGFDPDGFRFFINTYETSNGRLIFEVGNGSTGDSARTSTASVIPGQWQHVAAVVDRAAGSCRLFVDGVDVTSDASILTTFNTTGPWYLGQFLGDSFRYRGLLDEPAWWDRLLTPAEIARLASGASPLEIDELPDDAQTDVSAAMLGANSSVYARMRFDGPASPGEWLFLLLEMQHEDGFASWLNAAPAGSRGAPSPLLWNSAAIADRPWAEALRPEAFFITGLGSLQGTGNVLALQGLNSSAASEDFLLVPRLSGVTLFEYGPGTRTYSVPTPGQHNLPLLDEGATIASVAHSPAQPVLGDTPIVTATVFSPTGDPVTVELISRVMHGAETVTPMAPTGAGDVYQAALPLGSIGAGEMLRYRVRATVEGGQATVEPPFEIPEKSPKYHGLVMGPLEAGDVPVLHWFVEDPAAALVQDVGTRCSLYWNGDFYDNVFVRPRGQSSLGLYGDKQSFKFDFNPGYRFRLTPDSRAVDEINILSTWIDKAAIRPVLAWGDIADSGGEASISFPLVMQQDAEFYSVAIYVEQVDEDYLLRHGLDDEGALYKGVDLNPLDNAWTGIEKKTRLDEDRSDLEAFVAAIQPGAPGRSIALFDQAHLPSLVNYIAVMRIMLNRDHVQKNYYLYRDTEGSQEWRMLPWDLDLTYGRGWEGFCSCIDNDVIRAGDQGTLDPLYGSYAFGGFSNHLIDAVLSDPRGRAMVMRRLRTLMDELLQPPSTPVAQRRHEQRIDELVARLAPWVALDAARWGNPYGEPQDFATAVGILKNEYLQPRRQFLYVTNAMQNGGLVPGAQDPSVQINFGEADYQPVSGNSDEEYLVLQNPGNAAVDISGWRLEGGIAFTFEAGTVIPAQDSLHVADRKEAFRARATGPSGGMGLLVVGDFSGNLSNEGEIIRLVDRTGRLVAQTWIGPPLSNGWMLYANP